MRPAQGSPIDPSDYPTTALREEAGGFSRFRPLVSPLGIIERCEITVSSRVSDLDEKVCERVMHAKAFPARDQAGKPVYGVINGWVCWQMRTKPVSGTPFYVDGFLSSEACPGSEKSTSPRLFFWSSTHWKD